MSYTNVSLALFLLPSFLFIHTESMHNNNSAAHTRFVCICSATLFRVERTAYNCISYFSYVVKLERILICNSKSIAKNVRKTKLIRSWACCRLQVWNKWILIMLCCLFPTSNHSTFDEPSPAPISLASNNKICKKNRSGRFDSIDYNCGIMIERLHKASPPYLISIIFCAVSRWVSDVLDQTELNVSVWILF